MKTGDFTSRAGLWTLGLLTIGFFTALFFWMHQPLVSKPIYGVTFSTLYARELGLRPREVYTALVTEMNVRRVRLPLYWSDIQPVKGEFRWELYDELMRFSQDNQVALTPVVGVKVPRWPECYMPDWASSLSHEEQQSAALEFIKTAVNRYKKFSVIERWQVENEAYLTYGECPLMSETDLKERIQLVRQLDDRPIQITMSGELGPWLDAAQEADVLGISLYRQTWNDFFGYFVYPFPPSFYRLRGWIVRPFVQEVVVSELQAEPWFFEPIHSKPFEDWYDVFTAEMFEENISFASETGISEIYLWGAEWWYLLKTQGDERLWYVAEDLFK